MDMTSDNDKTEHRSHVETDVIGQRTLTEADLTAIRQTVFESVPINLMDTQKIILENKELKNDVMRLRGWVALLVDKVKDDTGLFIHTVEGVKPPK